MKNETRLRPLSAFTLIEMLIVIAIIGILAALILPLTSAVKKRGLFSRSQAQLAQLTLAIESYKEKLGHYPPDNPGNPAANQLYFELVGTINNGLFFKSLDGNAEIAANPAVVSNVFGVGVEGFVNSSSGGVVDDGASARSFLRDVKPDQTGTLLYNASQNLNVKVFVGPAPGPAMPTDALKNAPMNPVRYNASNPTNNPNSYDLWIDLIISGKTNRISNWSKQPQIVGTP